MGKKFLSVFGELSGLKLVITPTGAQQCQATVKFTVQDPEDMATLSFIQKRMVRADFEALTDSEVAEEDGQSDLFYSDEEIERFQEAEEAPASSSTPPGEPDTSDDSESTSNIGDDPETMPDEPIE